MRNLTKSLVSFLKKEDGPTAVEYAVMLALIIVVCIAAITTLGSNANETFSFVGSSIKPPDKLITGLGPTTVSCCGPSHYWLGSRVVGGLLRPTLFARPQPFSVPPIQGDETMAADAPTLSPQTATATKDDSLGIDRAFLLQMARMPLLAVLWVVAAVVAHQIWAAVSPTGLNAGPLIVVCIGMVLAAFIDGWALQGSQLGHAPAHPQRVDARPLPRPRPADRYRNRRVRAGIPWQPCLASSCSSRCS